MSNIIVVEHEEIELDCYPKRHEVWFDLELKRKEVIR